MLHDKKLKIKKKWSFWWLLYLGVLPIESAALTLYFSKPIGQYLSFAFNLVAILVAFKKILEKKQTNKTSLSQKYTLYFLFMILIYFFGSIIHEEFAFSRVLSLVCLLGYYLLIIRGYDSIDAILSDINKALLFTVLISFLFYILGNDNVLYMENATNQCFKGVVPNRNTFSEISLFYITTSFCLFCKKKMSFLTFGITSIIALYTTILTKSATSIICLIVLIGLLVVIKKKSIMNFCFSKFFWVAYLSIFVLLVLVRSTELVSYIAGSFGKSVTMTGRSTIWVTAIDLIKDAPLFGYGYDSTVLLSNGIRENDPHNGILYILLTSGLLGVILLVVMLRPLFVNESKDLENDRLTYRSMRLFVIVWLIRGLVESVFSYTHFVFWCAVIFMDLLSKKAVRGIYEQ